MKKIFTITILILAMVLTVSNQITVDNSSSLEKEVRKVHDKYYKTLTEEGSDVALEKFYADEYTYIGVDGKIIDKAGLKARMKRNELGHFSIIDNLKRISIYSNIAVLSGHSTSTATDKGTEKKTTEGYTEVWVKRNGRWRLTAEQITPQKPLISDSSKQNTFNPTNDYDLVIAGVNLIDGTGNEIKKGVNVFVKDKRIVKINANKLNKTSKNYIDGKGKYLIPGLIDGHAHPFPIKENFPRLIHYGVTSILVPGCSECTNESYAEMRRLSENETNTGPRVFHTSPHFTLEGRHPVKSYPSDKWVNGKSVFYLESEKQIETLVRQVAKQPIIGIKLTIEDGPEPPFVERMSQKFINKVAAEARKHNLKVFAHVSDIEEVRMVEKAGIKNIIHFVGVDIDWKRDATTINSLLKRDVSWVTTLMIDKMLLSPLYIEWLDRPEITEIYDKKEIEKLRDPKRIASSRKNIKNIYGIDNPTIENVIKPQVEDLLMLYKKGCNVVVGTDTGNDYIFPGFSMHEEMQLLELGGFKPLDIIKMSTHNGAKMLKALDNIGTIETGKYADMILLDKNPLESISNTLAINTVFKNGKIQKRLK